MQLYKKLPVLGKRFTLLIFFAALVTVSVYSFHRRSKGCHITLGSPTAKLAVKQQFSFGSEAFLSFVKHVFPLFKKEFVDTGFVSWTFAPNITDFATIQFVSCCNFLSDKEQSDFFLRVLSHNSFSSPEEITSILIDELDNSSVTEEQLDRLQAMKLGEFFSRAQGYYDQKVFADPSSYIEIGDKQFSLPLHPDAIRSQIEMRISSKAEEGR